MPNAAFGGKLAPLTASSRKPSMCIVAMLVHVYIWEDRMSPCFLQRRALCSLLSCL